MLENKFDQAQDHLTALPEELLSQPSLTSIQRALELNEQTAGLDDVDQLKALASQDPKDLQARYDYAMALYASRNAEDAILEFIEIIKQNDKWNDGVAKQQLFKIFEALGHSDPITIEGRKKLSAVLFS